MVNTKTCGFSCTVLFITEFTKNLVSLLLAKLKILHHSQIQDVTIFLWKQTSVYCEFLRLSNKQHHHFEDYIYHLIRLYFFVTGKYHIRFQLLTQFRWVRFFFNLRYPIILMRNSFWLGSGSWELLYGTLFDLVLTFSSIDFLVVIHCRPYIIFITPRRSCNIICRSVRSHSFLFMYFLLWCPYSCVHNINLGYTSCIGLLYCQFFYVLWLLL